MKKVSEFQVNGWAVIVAFCICMTIAIKTRIDTIDNRRAAKSELSVAEAKLKEVKAMFENIDDECRARRRWR